jgi:DNA topoisomerase-1
LKPDDGTSPPVTADDTDHEPDSDPDLELDSDPDPEPGADGSLGPGTDDGAPGSAPRTDAGSDADATDADPVSGTDADADDASPHDDRTRVLAGECVARYESGGAGTATRERTRRGRVVVLVKPDRTVLVHDAEGYQPVAWLTRPASLTVEADDDGFGLTARDGDERLRVVSAGSTHVADYPVSAAGVPVGECPDCGGVLVRAGGDVACLGCPARYGLPSGATVLDRPCPDCGLPRLRVERGEAFEVCLDAACDPLAERVADRFDGRYDCPDCGASLEARRARGRSYLGCADAPDCETTFSIPAGVVVGDCACGLPVFETATGRRCVDPSCDCDAVAGPPAREGDAGNG